jgi:hypothetical protein
MTPPLIGLLGHKRAGKDTFASRLIEEHGYARVAFADPLKEAALALDPIVYTFVGGPYDGVQYRLADLVAQRGWERAKEYPEARRILQHLGDAVRLLDPGFWVRAAMARVAELQATEMMMSFGGTVIRETRGLPVVITDVRYPNEAEAIREAGGTLVRILRPGADSADDAHSSEHALDDCPVDVITNNTGGLDELFAQADRLAISLH